MAARGDYMRFGFIEAYHACVTVIHFRVLQLPVCFPKVLDHGFRLVVGDFAGPSSLQII